MKRKTCFVLGVVLTSVLSWTDVLAGQTVGGYVSHIATVNGVLLFKITGGSDTSRPACATTGRYAAPVNSEHYQAIITAFQMGSQVTLGTTLGLGTCTRWSNSEDLRWVEMNR